VIIAEQQLLLKQKSFDNCYNHIRKEAIIALREKLNFVATQDENQNTQEPKMLGYEFCSLS
jgi:hypothetical protein